MIQLQQMVMMMIGKPTFDMKKLLELSLKSAFIAYIPIAFNFIGGFEMHLNPLDWSLQKIIIFIIFFILITIIESYFIKKKK